MDDFIKGQCTVWAGYDYPPKESTNVIWLRFDANGNLMNLFIKIVDEWYPLGMDDNSENGYQTMSSSSIKHIINSLSICISESLPFKLDVLWIKPLSNELYYFYNNEYNLLYKLVNTIDISPHSTIENEVPTVLAIIDYLNIKVDKSSIGLRDGVCGLDSNGFILESNLPVFNRDNMKMLGYWNANTNTPRLDFSNPLKSGSYYIVSVKGILNSIQYYKNDLILSYNNRWIRVIIFLDEEMNKKVDKVSGLGLSKNNFTDALLLKLNGIDALALKNTNSIVVRIVNPPSQNSIVLLINDGVLILPLTRIEAVSGKASKTQAESATNDTFYMTPLLVLNSIKVHAGSGLLLYLYSPNGTADWSNEKRVTDKWYHLSIDNGLTFGPSLLLESGGGGGEDPSVLWSNIINKPDSFNPSAHKHAIDEITDLLLILNNKENAFVKNTAFNKFFGNSASTVCEGNDIRLNAASDLANHKINSNNPHHTTKGLVGLGNVDNTSDLNKPISNATLTALNAKASLNGDINQDFRAKDFLSKTGLFEDLNVSGNLDVYLLTANQTRVTNGDLWIQDSAKITLLTIEPKGIFYFRCQDNVMKKDDLCVVHASRSTGGATMCAFEVFDDTNKDPNTGEIIYVAKNISGSYDHLQIGDLIVRVGNKVNKSRQSSVLNCVSFGGGGAATIYYSNVNYIPIGSYYPDRSKITSAIGDLRAIGYGSAAVYSTDGEFAGTLNSNKGNIANFTLEHDKLKAKNIQLIDGNMPTLLQLAGKSIIDSSVVRGNIDAPYWYDQVVERTITVDKPMTLIIGNSDNSAGEAICLSSIKESPESPEQIGNTTVALLSFNLKIYRRNQANELEEVFAYYDSSHLGDSLLPVMNYKLPKLTTTLSEGIYVILMTVGAEASPTLPINLPLKPFISISSFLNGYELRPLEAVTYIADNGITSFFGYSDYLRHEAKGDFIVRKGDYIFRVSSIGIKKSVNGGGSWQDV